MTNSSIPYETTLALPQKQIDQLRAACGIFRTESGQRYDYAHTQLVIIGAIAGRIFPRIQLILPTQYGKSDSVSQGILLRHKRREKWMIVAPTKKKGEIIMSYIIKHIFDHNLFKEKLVFDEPMEKMLQHRSKEHLTFSTGFEIMVLSADARNRQRTTEVLMGFGAPNVIIDESALIEDDLYATIKRMLGGHKDNFLLEIGNPFTRDHFLRTWLSPRYKTVWVDAIRALSEGRYTQDFLDEMQDEAFYDVLYQCLFPEGDEIRSDGYRRLVVDALISNSWVESEPPIVEDDKPVLGVDVAAGGENKTVFVLRYPKSGFAKVLEKNGDDDLDNQADRIIAYKRQYNIGDYRIVIDDGGVGHGLGDILKNKHDLLFKRVLSGETASENNRYANVRAELWWRVRKWLKQENGRLLRDDGFDELGIIYYKQNASDKLQIEPKQKLRERGILSPDTGDALMLTFVDTSSIVEEEDIFD